MHPRYRTAALVAFCAFAASPLFAQTSTVAPAPAVDRVFRISGAVAPPAGNAIGTIETVAFSIYDSPAGGTPLWQELQTVTLDGLGQYTALVGSTSVDGLPVDLFAPGEPRWLGIRAQRDGQVEQPRSLLTSVPYAVRAAKAADADTLGGRPASDFLLAGTANPGGTGGSTAGGAQDRATAGGGLDGPFTSGTVGRIGKFITSVDLGNSVMTENAGKIGLGTASPLDFMHTSFTDTTGAFTGYAVQNLGSGAASYSGMLFYDHLGALGQFQGFNNSSHEYRINNIASGGSINFMIAGTSALKVGADGKVGLGVGALAPEDSLHIKSNGSAILRLDGPVNTAGVGPTLRWTEATAPGNFGIGFEAFLDGFSNRLVYRTIDSGAVQINDVLVLDRGTGRIGMAVAAPLDQLHVAGDIRVGVGTTGCVKDADATVIAGTCSSDLRFKKDVTPFGSMLERVARLTPVNYLWRASEFADRHFGTAPSYGLIAQDVQKDFPDLVKIDEQGYLAVNYSKLPLLTIQAVKELKAENDALKTQNAALDARLRALEAAIERLQKP